MSSALSALLIIVFADFQAGMAQMRGRQTRSTLVQFFNKIFLGLFCPFFLCSLFSVSVDVAKTLIQVVISFQEKSYISFVNKLGLLCFEFRCF